MQVGYESELGRTVNLNLELLQREKKNLSVLTCQQRMPRKAIFFKFNSDCIFVGTCCCFLFFLCFLKIYEKTRTRRTEVRPFLIGRVKYEFRGFMFSKLVKSSTYTVGDTNEEKTSFLFLVLVSTRVSAQKLVYKNRETRISMLPI